jgi:hypothetical protein
VACSWLALILLVQLLVACPSPPEWLLVLHLLGLLLVACPSPPRMVLSFRFYSMVLLDDVLVCLWCYGRTVVFLGDGLVLVECELLALAMLIFISCWLSWAAVV